MAARRAAGGPFRAKFCAMPRGRIEYTSLVVGGAPPLASSKRHSLVIGGIQ
jgi:hypothetical protein